jgi:Mg/Co/Ni transporter MgtE
MSRRAAARLEGFGFDNVCVYIPAKQDWLAFGMPIEGTLATTRTAATAAVEDVPVCRTEEKLARARSRAEAAHREECVIVNGDRVVLGLLTSEMWQANGDLPVEQVMDPAPLTFRPHMTWQSVVEKMRDQKASVALVTRPDGKLIGLLKPIGTK